MAVDSCSPEGERGNCFSNGLSSEIQATGLGIFQTIADSLTVDSTFMGARGEIALAKKKDRG